MEPPVSKKARITDHFRVALKPQDVNAQRTIKKLKPLPDFGKENIEIITISDDEDENAHNDATNSKQSEVARRPVLETKQSLRLAQSQPQPITQQHSNLKVNSKLVAIVTKAAAFNSLDYIRDEETEIEDNLDEEVDEEVDEEIDEEIDVTTTDENIIENNNNNYAEDEEENFTNKKLETELTQQRLEHPVVGQPSQQLQPNLIDITNRSSSRRDSTISRTSPITVNKYTSPPGRNSDVIDHDKTLLNNILCEPYYAWDSFKYDRDQELKHISKKYLNDPSLNQEMTPSTRARLVDWLVELTNYFELDHEALYMAVKMADQYLMRKFIPRENLQLVYLTTLLISAKFDERLPPVTISELITTARQKSGIRYSRRQLTTFEVDILTTLEFNIRYPLSYGFLRRFAQCTRSDRKTLYLARYILETSLLNYEMIEELESKMAAGSLLLAFEMLHSDGAWDEAARFYTGYRQEELYPLVISLNDFIQSSAKRDSAITRKYSHEFFMKVARIPPLLDLFSSS